MQEFAMTAISRAHHSTPMNFRRRHHRLRIALFALCGLLFQQFAMAAYVCELDGAADRAATAAGPLPPCHQEPQANDKARCHAHCHPTVASPDASPQLTVPPSAIMACTPIEWVTQVALPIVAAGPMPRLRACATSPPLSIAYCSFQI